METGNPRCRRVEAQMLLMERYVAGDQMMEGRIKNLLAMKEA